MWDGEGDEWSVVCGRGEGDEWQRRLDTVELYKLKINGHSK